MGNWGQQRSLHLLLVGVFWLGEPPGLVPGNLLYLGVTLILGILVEGIKRPLRQRHILQNFFKQGIRDHVQYEP